MSDFKIVKLLDAPVQITLSGGPNPRGEYDNLESYLTGDSVSYLGSSYIAIGSTTGNLPTDTMFWQILAEKGDTGATGPAGTTDHLFLSNIGTNSHVQIDSHIASTSNPHGVTKTQVGLGNADNTSDADKPISTATQAALDVLEEIPEVTKEPTGFVNRTDSVISFDNGTRTFTISPAVTNYTIYIHGIKQVISTPLSIQIPNTYGNYYFSILPNGTLEYLTSFDVSALSDKAYISYVLWDDVNSEAIIFAEERHGLTMDWATHGYLHQTVGLQLASGANALFNDSGDGTLASDAQISLSDMMVYDEDIKAQIVNNAAPSNAFEQILFPIAEIPIYYRDGVKWVKQPATQYPISFGTIRANYNLNTLGTFSLAQAPNDNDYVATYIFATTNINEPIIAILSQDVYTSLDDATTRANWSSISFGSIPFQEIKLLYTVYYKTNSTYTNAVRSKIELVQDFRFGFDKGVSAISQITDHSLLTGLSSDDHLQYLNRSGVRPMTGSLVIQGDGAGSGHINLVSQSSYPATPGSGVSVFADQNDNLSWKGQSGQPASLDTSLLSEDRTYVLPDANGTILLNPLTTNGDILYQTSGLSARLPIGSENQELKVVSGLPTWSDKGLESFGSGQDGNLTLSGALTLTRDMYYDTLTLNAGAALNTGGFKIFCKTLDLSNAPASAIRRNGTNGGNSGSQAGGLNGGALNSSTTGGSGAGGAGASGVVGVGPQAATGTSFTNSNGGDSGAGGQGGAGTPNAGGASRGAATTSASLDVGRIAFELLRGQVLIGGGAGAPGGSAGGGDGVALGRGGGGGGSAGAVIALYAHTIVTSGSTPSSVITATGGNGGNGATATVGNVGGGGGGAGGGGGYIYLLYAVKSGPFVTDLLDSSGGNGGNGGNGFGTGTGARGGQGGRGGRVQVYNSLTASGSLLVGAVAAAGGLNSGLTGGTGSAGGAARVGL